MMVGYGYGGVITIPKGCGIEVRERSYSDDIRFRTKEALEYHIERCQELLEKMMEENDGESN